MWDKSTSLVLLCVWWRFGISVRLRAQVDPGRFHTPRSAQLEREPIKTLHNIPARNVNDSCEPAKYSCFSYPKSNSEFCINNWFCLIDNRILTHQLLPAGSTGSVYQRLSTRRQSFQMWDQKLEVVRRDIFESLPQTCWLTVERLFPLSPLALILLASVSGLGFGSTSIWHGCRFVNIQCKLIFPLSRCQTTVFKCLLLKTLLPLALPSALVPSEERLKQSRLH